MTSSSIIDHIILGHIWVWHVIISLTLFLFLLFLTADHEWGVCEITTVLLRDFFQGSLKEGQACHGFELTARGLVLKCCGTWGTLRWWSLSLHFLLLLLGRFLSSTLMFGILPAIRAHRRPVDTLWRLTSWSLTPWLLDLGCGWSIYSTPREIIRSYPLWCTSSIHHVLWTLTVRAMSQLIIEFWHLILINLLLMLVLSHDIGSWGLLARSQPSDGGRSVGLGRFLVAVISDADIDKLLALFKFINRFIGTAAQLLTWGLLPFPHAMHSLLFLSNSLSESPDNFKVFGQGLDHLKGNDHWIMRADIRLLLFMTFPQALLACYKFTIMNNKEYPSGHMWDCMGFFPPNHRGHSMRSRPWRWVASDSRSPLAAAHPRRPCLRTASLSFQLSRLSFC